MEGQHRAAHAVGYFIRDVKGSSMFTDLARDQKSTRVEDSWSILHPSTCLVVKKTESIEQHGPVKNDR
jgi:hypothetical protein